MAKQKTAGIDITAPSGTLFPIDASTGPWMPVLNAMSAELRQHIEWFSALNPENGKVMEFYDVDGYQQNIVNFARATFHVAGMERARRAVFLHESLQRRMEELRAILGSTVA